MKARAFLDAVRGYNAQPAGSRTPPQDRPPKMGTIDPAYAGLGPAKVQFDGETSVSAKAYVCVNCQVAPNDRVVLIPAGKTLIIIGTVGGGSLAPGTSIEGYWTVAPSGFMLEVGTVLVRATYPALFAAIGTAYNTGGETSLQFRIPDSRGATIVGKAASGTFATLGVKVGAESVTHSHPLSNNGHAAIDMGAVNPAAYVKKSAAGSWTATHQIGAGTGAASSFATTNGADLMGATDGTLSSVIQPSIVLSRAIKL